MTYERKKSITDKKANRKKNSLIKRYVKLFQKPAWYKRYVDPNKTLKAEIHAPKLRPTNVLLKYILEDF